MNPEDEERLRLLREKLEEHHDWPSVYMFKFVIPTDPEKIEQIHNIFGESVEYRERLSKNGNYTSITIREMILKVDVIFDRYREVNKIDGVISL
ncbi:MAG: DUF493 family protein [Flavobacteriales bacterium]